MSNPFGPPEKPSKTHRAPPPNPFAAGNPASVPAVTSSTSLSGTIHTTVTADSTIPSKHVNPPPKPSFLLNKEPPGKLSNPFGEEIPAVKSTPASAGNPFGRGETVHSEPPPVPAKPLISKGNPFKEDPVPNPPHVPLVPPSSYEQERLPPPLPPVPPSDSGKFETSPPPPVPAIPFPVSASDDITDSPTPASVPPPPPPPIPTNSFEPPHLPSLPPPDLSPPASAFAKSIPAANTNSDFSAPILGIPPSVGDDDPFAFDAHVHSLGAASTKVVENPFAPKPVTANVVDPFLVPPTSTGFESFGTPTSNAFEVDPFASSVDPFATNASQPLVNSNSFGKETSLIHSADPFTDPFDAPTFPPASNPFVQAVGNPPTKPQRRPSSDPFALPKSDPFVTAAKPVSAPVTDDFTSSTAFPVSGTASVPSTAVPETLLPIPAPTPVDDDPYLIITNKPPPVPVVPVAEVKAVSKPREEPAKKRNNGDPFDIPIPELPKKEAPKKVVDPTANVPLNELIAKSKVAATAAANSAPTITAAAPVQLFATFAPSAPIAPAIPYNPAPNPTVPIVAKDPQPVTVSVQAPVTVPHEPSFAADPFIPSKSDPFASAQTSTEDPFGNAFVEDPFAASTAATVDDFDIFNSSPVKSKPTSSAATSSFVNSKPAVSAPLQSTSKSSATISANATTTFAKPGANNKPVNLLEGDWVDVSTSASAVKPAQTIHDSTFDDVDPFSVGVVDDPFAPTHKTHDPFSTSPAPAPVDSHEEMMEKFKLMYGVKSDLTGEADEDDDSDNDHHAKGKRHDIYDSDFDDDLDNPKTKSNNKPKVPVKAGEVPQGLQYGQMIARGTNTELIDGEILSRLSTRSLVVKEWHDTYYVIIKGVLFLYKSKLDYQYNPKGTNYKKRLPITYNLSVSPLKAKEYKGYGTVYNFMMEEVMDYGRTNVGKFGSTVKVVAENLWRQLRAVILYQRHMRAHPPEYK